MFGIVTIIRNFLDINKVMGYSSLMSALMFIGGVILMVLGMIGEYVGRIYICLNASPQYVIKDTINCEVER